MRLWETFDAHVAAVGSSSASVSVGPITPAADDIAIFAFTGNNGGAPGTLSGWFPIVAGQNGFFAKLAPSGVPLTATSSITSGNWGANLALFRYGAAVLSGTVTSVTGVKTPVNLVTVTVNNNFVAGTEVQFIGLTNFTGLNGNAYTIVSRTDTTVTVSFTLANDYGPTADTGTAFDLGVIQVADGSSGAIATSSYTFSKAVTAGSTLMVIWFAENAFQNPYGALSSVSDTSNGSWPSGNMLNTPHQNSTGAAYIGFIQNSVAAAPGMVVSAFLSPSFTAGTSTFVMELAAGSGLARSFGFIM